MSNKHDFPIPPGFTWNHAKYIYVHPDGRTWDSDSNIMYDKDGRALKTSVDLPISPSGAVGSGGVTADESLEQMIQRKNLTAPRVTPADVDAAIRAEQFEQPSGTMLTICILTLSNGFTVTGESACASPENFNAEVGKKAARDDAKRKIWPLLGYALRDKLSKELS